MRLFWKIAISLALAAISLGGSFAQGGLEGADGSNVGLRTLAAKSEKHGSRPLTPDDRLSLLASALDAHVQRNAEPDCSHLVHAIYEAAGFPYDYAPSSNLYAGVESFERVKLPLPGDLVVWRGHVGIVVKPSQHTFFSYLSSGPGTDDYGSGYWKHRGRHRFYRYIKKEFVR